MDFDAGLQLWQSCQKSGQCAKVELIREALNDALHQILLRNLILTADDLLHHSALDNILWHTMSSQLPLFGLCMPQ